MKIPENIYLEVVIMYNTAKFAEVSFQKFISKYFVQLSNVHVAIEH